MEHYTHLTEAERYQISALLATGLSLSSIGACLGRNKSTISREIKRNQGRKGYRPKQAQRFSLLRKAQNQSRYGAFFWAIVIDRLKKYHSPEQISGRLKQQGWDDVASPETIYRYIYDNKKKGGDLYRHLRAQKTYRKRHYKGNDRRGQIPHRRDIDERPQIVEERRRFGDFEGDTIVGKAHKGVVLTLVDRTTRLIKMRALPHRTALLVAGVCVDLLGKFKVQSITFDNGKEFSAHEWMASQLNTDVYFAKAYHSWERGTNENTNGLVRQFFPKSMRLDRLTESEVQMVEDYLNHRPRKVLDYLTPLEALAKI